MTAAKSGAERRRHPRFEADFRVFVMRDGRPASAAEVLDLSASGIQLRHAEPSKVGKPGDEVVLCVRIPGEELQEITLVGTVVRVGERELALAFAQADIGDAALVASLWCDRRIPNAAKTGDSSG